MPLLTLDQVKGHLRVGFDDDDAEITIYRDASENAVVEYLDRPVYLTAEEIPAVDAEGYDAYAMVLTPAITGAILLLIGDFYEHREADPKLDGNAVLPRAVRSLLAPWRVWRTSCPAQEVI